jgi:hypothetical protein
MPSDVITSTFGLSFISRYSKYHPAALWTNSLTRSRPVQLVVRRKRQSVPSPFRCQEWLVRYLGSGWGSRGQIRGIATGCAWLHPMASSIPLPRLSTSPSGAGRSNGQSGSRPCQPPPPKNAAGESSGNEVIHMSSGATPSKAACSSSRRPGSATNHGVLGRSSPLSFTPAVRPAPAAARSTR